MNLKYGKYYYMGLGAFVALFIAAGAFFVSGSSQAAEDGIVSALASEGGFGDMEHPGPGRGDRDGHRRGRGFGRGDNSALLEELGVTEEEWDAAKETVQATFEDGEEKPDRETVEALFADELGVTVAEIDAAKEAVKEAKLAEALANGDITQEQIDTMEARQAVAETVDKEAITAEILGVTAEELEAAKEDGTMRDLVEASGLSREDIATATQEAYSAAVDQAVEDGIITQEQADLLEESGFDGPRGGKGGRGNGNRGNGGRGGNGNGANTGDA